MVQYLNIRHDTKKKIPLILNILKKVTSLYLICAQLIKLTFIAWIQGTVLNNVNQKSLRNSSCLQGNEQVNNHKIWQAELRDIEYRVHNTDYYGRTDRTFWKKWHLK